jgi:hypothetical protein
MQTQGLNCIMKSLILNPTDTSQWYTLILEAESKSQINLNVDTESYLVFLLMRSSRSTVWLDSILGIELMDALQQKGHQQKQMLMDIGDKSLLLSGFFSENVLKRKLDPMYFVKIGQIAYASVGAFPDESQHQLYKNLSENFLNLKEILKQAKQIYLHELN